MMDNGEVDDGKMDGMEGDEIGRDWGRMDGEDGEIVR